MKKPFLLLLFLWLLFLWFIHPVFSQGDNQENVNTPEKQISFAREKKTHTYYVKQAELWWGEVQKDKKSETSWFNYYRACRNAQGTADWKEEFVQESSALKLGVDIVKLMKTHIPDTFTYYFVAGSTGGVASDGDLLLKAYRLNPDFEGIQATVVTHATTTLNDGLRKEVNERWFKRNELSPNLMAYAYNVLLSLEPGAILLTENDNDTYPLWMLQDAKNIRTDVSVINIDFLLDENFREKTFQKLRIKPLGLGEIHVNDYSKNWEKVVHHFVTGYKTDKPLYLSMSMAPARYEGLAADMFATGLAWRYSKQKISTLASNQELFNNQLFFDYIKNNFSYDVSEEFVEELNLNYLPLLKECFVYYKSMNDASKLNKINKITTSILEGIEDKQVREKYTNSFFKPDLPVQNKPR
ncbi:MAG: hypothetical protein H7Z21_16575 [Hymenobacter sp.]|nr:hypothetical protein [Hymenobacter sp.]